MMAGRSFLGGLAGTLAFVGVFNNSQAGFYLVVQGCEVWTPNGPATAVMELISGNPFTVQVGEANPIDATQNAGPGIMVTGYNGTCLGGHLIELPLTTSGFSWPYPYPLAYVAPGYMLAAQGGGAALGVQAGFMWWYTQYPY